MPADGLAILGGLDRGRSSGRYQGPGKIHWDKARGQVESAATVRINKADHCSMAATPGEQAVQNDQDESKGSYGFHRRNDRFRKRFLNMMWCLDCYSPLAGLRLSVPAGYGFAQISGAGSRSPLSPVFPIRPNRTRCARPTARANRAWPTAPSTMNNSPMIHPGLPISSRRDHRSSNFSYVRDMRITT